jgi:hypothetical protein
MIGFWDEAGRISRLKIRQKPDAKECVLAIHGRHALAVLWAHAGSVLSDGDFHPAVGAHSQAHWDGHQCPSPAC